MSTKQAVKFTFNTHFGSEDIRPGRHASATHDDSALEDARAQAWRDGFAAGEKEAKLQGDHALSHALDTLAANAGGLLAALDATSAAMRAEAIDLAALIARKLAPALIATRPQTEIEAVLRDCLTHLNREPHILLRVAPELVDSMKDAVDQMAMERGLTGRVILLGEGSMMPGDCLVEWADGGVRRDTREIEADISAIISRYIATRAAPRGQADRLAMAEPTHLSAVADKRLT
ncbi:MAG: FliH/SctL family protein [Parvibaculum sp.]